MLNIDKITYELRAHGVSDEKIKEVETAYQIADEIHKDQIRESGEPYIIHPLNVANNLLEMEVYDPDTISAALLHDTIEDAEDEFNKEDVAKLINPTVAELVDGVTKIRGMNHNKKEQNFVNTRKLVNGLTKDVRIIFIKLADRLHNMETLEFKRPEKQYDNAEETMNLFVPIAEKLGAYRIKNKLEDLSLMYMHPDEYKRILEARDEIEEKELPRLKEMAFKITTKLDNANINNEIVFRHQTINTLYKKTQKGYEIPNVYDTCYFKVLVDEKKDCYYTLYLTHELFTAINGRLKDYISNPRTNTYQSLHMTVIGSKGLPTKIKTRTFDMDKIAGFGIPAYWNLKEERGRKTIEETQKLINSNFQLAKQLKEIDKTAKNDAEYYDEIFSDVFTPSHVYVYTTGGVIVELPKNSTAFDFACEVHGDKLDQLTGILVNGREVSSDYKLKNNDTIEIKVDGKVDANFFESSVENAATTSKAKQRVKQFNERNRQNF